MMDPKINTLRKVLECNSYTRAAALLHLSQPAVTGHIQRLEEECGVSLIERRERQFVPTVAGSMLLAFADEMESRAAGVLRAMWNSQKGAGRYRLGATLTLAEYVLPGMLKRYEGLQPGTELILHTGNQENVLILLRQGALDLAFVENPAPSTGFERVVLGEDVLVAVCAPAHPFAARSGITLAEWASDSRIILREEGSGARLFLEAKLREAGVSLKEDASRMESGTIGVIKALVRENLGISLLSRRAIAQEVREGSLIPLPITDVSLKRPIQAFYRSDGPVPFIHDFLQTIASWMNPPEVAVKNTAQKRKRTKT